MSTWFRYHDDVKNKDFYYNNDTQQTVWKFPTENATVWDAKTLQKINPPSSTKSSSKGPHVAHDGSAAADHSANSGRGDSRRSMTVRSAPKNVARNQTNDLFKEMINNYAQRNFDMDEFSSLYLKKIKGKKGDGFYFSETPLSDSLVNTLKKNEVKVAVKNYKLVMKLTGIYSPKVKGELIDLVHTVKENRFLVDEVFVELWKQTNNAPPEALQQGLQVFLVMVTLFFPGAPFHVALLRHIASIAKDNDFAKFVLIRLDAICSQGEPSLKFPDDTSILTIPSHPNTSIYYFGVSLWEIFYHQRRSCPKLPIPLVMYKMLTQISKLNGINKVGIFRLPGNMARLDTLVYKANHEEEYLEGEELDCVASLFKRWLRDIPGMLIREYRVTKLMEVTTADDAISFAEELEFPNKMVMMYLVGFLRDVAANKEVNQMGEKNLAMVFGPNVVSSDKVNPMELQARIQGLLQSLIEKWDVSTIYPLYEDLLPQ